MTLPWELLLAAGTNLCVITAFGVALHQQVEELRRDVVQVRQALGLQNGHHEPAFIRRAEADLLIVRAEERHAQLVEGMHELKTRLDKREAP